MNCADEAVLHGGQQQTHIIYHTHRSLKMPEEKGGDVPYTPLRHYGMQNNSNSNKSTMSKQAATLPQHYADDIRISKILRLLVGENNPNTALDLCRNLETAVRSPSNAAYICRSFEFILENVMLVLRHSPVKCLEQASVALGLIGYINRTAFQEFKSYIIKAYQSYQRTRKYIIAALKVTFSCDAVNLDLISYSDELIALLKDYLENVETADMFITLSETILEFSKNYKRSFEQNFTDIVDIVVGWHLEVEQPLALKIHCSMVLQQFAEYFIVELSFTLGLLGQFLEDIATFRDELTSNATATANTTNANAKPSLCTTEHRIGTFIGAFNSVLKSLCTKIEIDVCNAARTIVDDAFCIIMKSAKLIFSSSSLGAETETILNINEFFCLIFSNKYFSQTMRLQKADIEEVIQLQIHNVELFNENQQVSLFYVILLFIRKYRTTIPYTLVTLIFQTDGNELERVKWRTDSRHYKLLLKIYHEVLMLKNVPLLQEAYRHITRDIERNMLVLAAQDDTVEKYKIAKAETTLNFYLAAISSLAIQTSSIIGMYALYPSILELLITNCKVTQMDIWSKHPTLHSGLLHVLIIHCQKNYNFIRTSRLFTEHHFANEDENNSPTSENYTLILKYLAEILRSSQTIEKINLILILDYLKQLFEESREYAHVLRTNEHFLNICKNLVRCVRVAPLECGACIEILQKYAVLHNDIWHCLQSISVAQFDSMDDDVRQMYTRIFGKLPLELSVVKCEGSLNAVASEPTNVYELQQWYRSTMHATALRSKYFKLFLASIDLSSSGTTERSLHELFHNYFNKSWVFQLNQNAVEYQKATYSNSRMIEMWLQYEAARYCVQNKLRTTIGKPQETFLAIEALIMMYARMLGTKTTTTPSGTQSMRQLSLMRRNARLLLGFLENLEKLIYNAAEGTAFAFVPFEKSSSTFFRINAHTCSEWFKRIRTSVNLVALQSSQFDMVIRVSENILKSSGGFSDTHMDHTVISLVWALINSKEADTLHGLYTWTKEKFGKRYIWIQFSAEQAAGQKEKAADGYASYLFEHEKSINDNIKEFILDQMLDCFYFTGQWSKMRDICNRFKGQALNLTNARTVTNLDLVESVLHGSNGTEISSDVRDALQELSEWPHTERITDSFMSNNTSYNIVRELENEYIAHILKNDSSPISDEVQQVVLMEVQDCIRHDYVTRANDQVCDFIILNSVAQQIGDGADEAAACPLNCHQAIVQSTILTKCLFWTMLLDGPQGAPSANSGEHCGLYLDVAMNARLEGNLNYSRFMLERFFALKGFDDSLLNISQKVQENSFVLNIEDADLLRGFTELAKYMFNYSTGNAINLGSSFCLQIIQHTQHNTQERSYPETSIKMLLTLADWLGQRGTNFMDAAQLKCLLKELPNYGTSEHDNSLIPHSEKAVGKLISASIFQNTDSGEAWCAFGNWCYRWGKKIMESKNSENNGTLTQRDLVSIADILGDSIEEPQKKQLVDILNSHHLHVYDGLDDIEANETNCTELIEIELRKIEQLNSMPVEKIANIIRIWREAHKNVYSYYEMATQAYFKYLSIQTAQTETENGGNPHRIEDSTFVTTTLRLLRLIVKHAIGLQEVLEEGLKTTPLRPWKIIIPQLFSRLNHHEPYVRKSVSELLCRLAKDKPHLIIFPTVVGAHQELKDKNLQTELNMSRSKVGFPDGNNSSPKAAPTTTTLSTCFNSLLRTLFTQSPETVLHVQLLIKELKRVTLLWEEYWTHSLAQLYNEYSSHFSALEVELRKNNSANLENIEKKYEILIGHLAADFQRIADTTAKKPETNYERNFQERFNVFISKTLAELSKPINLNKPNDGWLSIKQLYTVFQQRPLRGSASTLKLSDLSPVLGNMLNTAISMPGVNSYDQNNIYIKSVDNIVYILPTKTKPKKLTFFGSNGKKYSYLFKGLEDLHLDERIMQFLSITNSMMARSSDLQYNKNNFKAFHYSVIPLGPQSGLISWVDGVTPLFSIYKKWQQRQTSLTERATANASLQQVPNPPSTRPSDLFYNKLTPLLAEQNMKVTDPRKQWPINILRQVLEELCQETPKDLLAKELWCSALTAADWRKSLRNYVASAAVMSVIGYVIGLGDRHLDNVLIKLTTGEIVHIDYNVCFEKGKTLRVPEKVPFRMTPNLVEALGLTGIEGPFRIGCENVLKILRKERETLLTLLEAFVYDPLVDWTVSDDDTTITTRVTTAYAAAQSIAALNPSAVRLRDENIVDACKSWKPNANTYTRENIGAKFSELRSSWTQYNDDVRTKLAHIDNSLKQLVAVQTRLRDVEQNRDSISKQHAIIRELDALGSAIGSHTLNTITQRYNAYRRDREAFTEIEKMVKETYSAIHVNLQEYFDGIATPLASRKMNCLRQLFKEQEIVYSNEVLRQLDEGLCMRYYDRAGRGIGDMLAYGVCSVKKCLDMLEQYVAVVKYYPQSRWQQNHLVIIDNSYTQLLMREQSAAALLLAFTNCIANDQMGQNFKKASALQYAAAMDEILVKLSDELDEALNVLEKHNEQVPSSATDLAEIQEFIAMDTEHNWKIINYCLVRMAEKANESFCTYEEWPMRNDEDCMINDQIGYLSTVRSMFNNELYTNHQPDFSALDQLSSVLDALNAVHESFELSLLDRIVQLYMFDTNVELQEALQLMCSAPSSFCSTSQLQRCDAPSEFVAVLHDVNALFEQFDSKLPQLQAITMDIVEKMPECKCQQFVKLRVENCDFAAVSRHLKHDTLKLTFETVRDQVNAFKANDAQIVYDIRSIAAPIRQFVVQLEKAFLCGLTTLFGKAFLSRVDNVERSFLSVPTTMDAQLIAGERLCASMCLGLQHQLVKQRQQRNVRRLRTWLEQSTLVASAHLWMNEQCLADTTLISRQIIQKAALLDQLETARQSVCEWQQTMSEVLQALNEKLAETTTHHTAEDVCNKGGALAELALTDISHRLRLNITLATQLSHYVDVLKYVEQHGSSSNHLECDTHHITILQIWQDAVGQLEKSNALITGEEQAIVELLDPEGNVDQCWINNIAGLLDELAFASQRDLESIECEATKIKGNLYDGSQQLEVLINTPLRLEVRQILKMILKTEKQSRYTNRDGSALAGRVRQLQYRIKAFFSTLIEIQQKFAVCDFSTIPLEHVSRKVVELLAICDQNSSEFLQLVSDFMHLASTSCPNDASSTIAEADSKSDAAQLGAGGDKSTLSIADKKTEQKRNAYAVSVWKRIRMKLEGRDPDPNHRSTVAEQIHYIVQEATNPDNLAVLYEGWTPWV